MDENITTFMREVKKGLVSTSSFLKGLSSFSKQFDRPINEESEEESTPDQSKNCDLHLAIKSLIELTIRTCEGQLPSHVFLNTNFWYERSQPGLGSSLPQTLVSGLDSLMQIHLHTQTPNPLQRWAHIAVAVNFSRQYPQIIDNADALFDAAQDARGRTTEGPILGSLQSEKHTGQPTKHKDPIDSEDIKKARIEPGMYSLGFMVELCYGARGDLAIDESLPGYQRALTNWNMLLRSFVLDQPHHRKFRASLSTSQLNSARLLVEWWNGELENNENSKRAFQALERAALAGFLDGDAFELLGISSNARTGEKRQYYQQRCIFDSSGSPYLRFMFAIYQLEFLPYHYLRRLSRKALDNTRKIAARQAACQRVAMSCLSSLLPLSSLDPAAEKQELQVDNIDQNLEKVTLGDKIPSPSPTAQADVMKDSKEMISEPLTSDTTLVTMENSMLTMEESQRLSRFIKGEPGSKIGASICTCPWLADSDIRSELPYYLWDLKQKRTVVTEKLNGEIEYTAISHTWGRWIKDDIPPAQVDGVVNWMIPENSKFEVRELPNILASFPVSTPYIWFDLVCIPQISADPDIMEISRREIGRQASIFRFAKSAIAWFNEVTSWKGLKAAIRRLSIHYIQCGNPHINPQPYLDLIAQDTDLSLELFDQTSATELAPEDSMNGWFCSLWTLQEVCLRPDMRLCNKAWEILAFGKDEAAVIGLDDLVALSIGGNFASESRSLSATAMESVDVSDSNSQGTGVRTWIRSKATESLWELFDLSGLEHLLDASRATILMLGNQRHCSSNRAEAIMSAIGVTDWYNDSGGRAESPGSDSEPLLQYPLSFIREASEKIGADFYASVPSPGELLEMLVMSLVIEGPRKDIGSMLPFTSGLLSRSPSSAEGLTGDDHPAVSTWKIQNDGSVEVRELGIVSYTGQPRGISRNLNCHLNAPVSQDPVSLLVETQSSVDLDAWVDSFVPTTRNFAVCIHHGESVVDGILLKQVAPRELIKVGTYIISKEDVYLNLAPTTYQVSWRIL